MDSIMQEQSRVVVGGVDAHADAHHAAVLDERGVLWGSSAFPATSAGYRELLGWLESFGMVAAVAVESTSSYAAGLTRYLCERGVRVVEVNQPHAYTRRRRGKSDPIDAEMAARRFLSGEAIGLPKQTDGVVESIRMLRVARNGAVKARTAALLQARDLIRTALQDLREQLTVRKTLRAQLNLCGRLRPTSKLGCPTQAAKFALRTIARRVSDLEREIAGLDGQLAVLVKRTAPRTTSLLGVSTHNGGQLLVTAGQNIDRLTKESSFAALCAASPIKASSGKTHRHRCNPGGDRQGNRALHLIAVYRLKCCPRTQAYAHRRTQQGKSKAEIIRCLKRAIAREVYHALRADLADLTTPTPPPPKPPRYSTTIHCGNPGHGITRHRT